MMEKLWLEWSSCMPVPRSMGESMGHSSYDISGARGIPYIITESSLYIYIFFLYTLVQQKQRSFFQIWWKWNKFRPQKTPLEGWDFRVPVIWKRWTWWTKMGGSRPKNTVFSLLLCHLWFKEQSHVVRKHTALPVWSTEHIAWFRAQGKNISLTEPDG